VDESNVTGARGYEPNLYLPPRSAPPAGERTTAVNIAFDVFLSTAQTRHAICLLRALAHRRAADRRALALTAHHSNANANVVHNDTTRSVDKQPFTW
jgi:hypothetical protein